MDRAEKPSLIALIPAYNEELTISMVVMLSQNFVDKVIVVNDGSKDRTSMLASMAGAEVIELESNQGKAAALKRGFEACIDYDPDCVVMLDGDGQMDPALIPELCRPIIEGNADMVIGSRYLDKKVTIPRYRRFGLKILNSATNAGSETSITDSQSGFRAFSKKALMNMDFHSEFYNIESDLIIHFNNVGLKIIEVPITVRYDVPNGHKQNPWTHGLTVLSRMVGVIGYKKPLVLFGIPGLFLFGLGGILCLFTYFDSAILFDWTLVTQGIAGLLTIGIGASLMFTALILNSLVIIMEQKKK